MTTVNHSHTPQTHLTSPAVFYRVNNLDVTYTYFCLNLGMIVLHLLIVILNAIIIAAVRRSRKVQEPSGHCLISLSAAHIWLGLMMIYTGIYGLVNMQEKNECLLRFGLTHHSLMLVSWQNIMLTLDRFIQIEFPFWYKKHFHISTVWLLNGIAASVLLFYCLTPLILSWYQPKQDRNNICEYLNILPASYLQGFLAVTFLVLFIISAMYLRLLWTSKKHLRTIQVLSAATAGSGHGQVGRTWRPVLIACAISAVYLVCWSPPGVFLFVLTIDPHYPKITYSYATTLAVLITLPGLSAVVNPFIYTVHREVKFNFLRIIGLRRKDERFRPSTVTNQFRSRKSTTTQQGTFTLRREHQPSYSTTGTTQNSTIQSICTSIDVS